MTDLPPLDRESRVANLAIDPDVLARELEAEQVWVIPLMKLISMIQSRMP